jgi:hypothetical protein
LRGAFVANNRIGKENYFLSGDGFLMPIRKDQPPPDLRYFKSYGR